MNRDDQNDIDNQIDYERDPLMLAARQLPQGIAPGRDLWPGIAAGIEEQREAPSRRGVGWNRLFAQAAAVLLLIGGSSGVTWLAMKQDAPVVATEPDWDRVMSPPAPCRPFWLPSARFTVPIAVPEGALMSSTPLPPPSRAPVEQHRERQGKQRQRQYGLRRHPFHAGASKIVRRRVFQQY